MAEILDELNEQDSQIEIKEASSEDESLSSMARKIIERREKILDEFAVAYLASLSITETVALSHLIQRVELCEQETREDGKFGFKYWFRVRSEDGK